MALDFSLDSFYLISFKNAIYLLCAQILQILIQTTA